MKENWARHVLIGTGLVLLASLFPLGAVFAPTPVQTPEPGKPVPVPTPVWVPPTGIVRASDDSILPFTTVTSGFSANQSQISKIADPAKYARKKIALNDTSALVTINNITYPLRAYQTHAVSTDPRANQWWSTSPTLTQAWDITTGSSGTTIAIIDTGFGLAHEDLAGRWYVNPGESGVTAIQNPSKRNCTDRGLPVTADCNLLDDNYDGIIDNETGPIADENASQLNCTDQGRPINKSCNLVDDDGNGYADDVTGWDFIDNDRSVQAGELDPAGSGTTHGTMVAGVAAASGNNGVGIAGVNWKTKILPIQALDDTGYGDTVSVGQSIYYAITQHPDIISISLGTSTDDPYVRQAVEAATAAGILVVASSGNNGCNCISYPAHYPEVVAVGATDSTGTTASFSSWGSDLDITAPGVNINTSTWRSTNQTSAYATGVSGTSFAAPYVAGLAALIKSQDPAMKPLHLIAALTETVSKSTNMTSQPQDGHYGFGIARPLNAVQRVTSGVAVSQDYRFSPVSAGTYLRPSQPTDISGIYNTVACATTLASTPVYRLVSGGREFFSISRPEIRAAQSAGYTASLSFYTCLAQSRDTVNSVSRIIDPLKEFDNNYQKP